MEQLAKASGGMGALSSPSVETTRIVLNQAQIDALFQIEHNRLHGARDENIDVLAIGAQAIGALIGAFLLSR
ncbi:MAG: hypothetical protein ABIS68_09270 [Casimicrobiaceae bacterium]